MKKVLVIDNYDSFTWQSSPLSGRSRAKDSVQNDEFDIDEIAGFDKNSHFSWSWSSDEAGLLKDVI
jgi:anthranilate/para-aminobenzoate synthase component II